jgi:serine/threonine protein kinase
MNPSEQSSDQLADLTERITRKTEYYTAFGGFGEVWPCMLQTGAKEIVVRPSRTDDHHHLRYFQVAVKVIRLEGAGVNEKVMCNIMTPIYVLTCCAIQALRLELGTWKRLHHANILPLLGTTRGFAPYISMVSPWLENGSLMDYLLEHQDMTLAERLRIVSF